MDEIVNISDTAYLMAAARRKGGTFLPQSLLDSSPASSETFSGESCGPPQSLMGHVVPAERGRETGGRSSAEIGRSVHFCPAPCALCDSPRRGFDWRALGNRSGERQVGGGAPVAKTRLGASQPARRFLRGLRSVQVCVTLVYGFTIVRVLTFVDSINKYL
ncbi:hypothetical protein HJG60_011556 [Phyllostomus discolor]|uniref:Uncharacterized protein n=1 Tax=Phyllostomus discolor TaxID=89673 RepID=A0A833ZTV6_9CHIR|nr:hypothetical protein HJG60_011556 [Phyllostomus discolor]